MSVDIVFSMDSTGSMSPCIQEVRRKVTETITTLFNNVENLRIGLISHGDYCDEEKLINIQPLTNDINALINFIKTTPNTGGGDEDEAYEYVLHRAQEFEWNADNKALVLIGDCSPHPVGYRWGWTTNKLDWKSEAELLVENGIKIYPVQALNRVHNNAFYDTLAKISGTQKLPLNQFGDIISLLTAVTYLQQSTDKVQEYGDQLQSLGQMNRTTAQIFDLILGRTHYSTGVDRLITRSTGDAHELKEVDPARFQVLHVDRDEDIKSFVNKTGALFRIGRGFYELTKPELVQERKEVVLRDKKTGDMWSGAVAREMIGLPYGMRGKVHPKYGFDYDVFIQSTSANRKLIGGTRFLYEAK
jgi:hypothetical protein